MVRNGDKIIRINRVSKYSGCIWEVVDVKESYIKVKTFHLKGFKSFLIDNNQLKKWEIVKEYNG
jgi:hypothetical protein